ncbi:MAG: DUF4443 domain-containing protein [Promethearchaeota archaeon]
MFEELNKLFISKTIKPTFERVHVIIALFIFGEHSEGIGRYRLKEELAIGSGTARSLVDKLNEKIKFLKVSANRKGHILTEKGAKFLNKIKQKISIIKEAKSSVLKDIIINSKNIFSYFCLVKNSAHRISTGIVQRDAAIKVSGIGATCLVYNGSNLIFPSGQLLKNNKNIMKINEEIQNYFKTLIKNSNSKLEKDDVIIIGLADNPYIARLATINAALTLID